MLDEVIKPNQLYGELNTELQRMLAPNNRTGCYEDDIILASPWIKVGENDGFRVKAIHPDHELFVKSYAPKVREYSLSAFSALQDLSRLKLQIPILPVLGKYGNSLFFRLGEPTSTLDWNRLPENDRKAIQEVVKSYGLQSLGNFDMLPLISVEGVDYLVDPFEDSVHSIGQFLEQRARKVN